MYLRIQAIRKHASMLVATSLTLALSSCGNKDKDNPEEEPVVQPIVKATKPAEPKPTADPTAMFLTPKDENLPTTDQLKQGAESSIGTGDVKPITDSPTEPSTTAKPPVPPKPDEDQLDPGE